VVVHKLYVFCTVWKNSVLTVFENGAMTLEQTTLNVECRGVVKTGTLMLDQWGGDTFSIMALNIECCYASM